MGVGADGVYVWGMCGFEGVEVYGCGWVCWRALRMNVGECVDHHIIVLRSPYSGHCTQIIVLRSP